MPDLPSKIDLVIDIQSLRDKNDKLFPKEVAVASLQNNLLGHWLIKSPSDFNELPKKVVQTNTYCSRHLHGVQWFDGEISLEKLQAHLQELAKSAAEVYVRGDEKTRYLQTLIGRQVIDIERHAAPTFQQLDKTFPKTNLCTLHGLQLSPDVKYFCAMQKVLQLKEWFVMISAKRWVLDSFATSSSCYYLSLIWYAQEGKNERVTVQDQPEGNDEVDEDDEDFVSFEDAPRVNPEIEYSSNDDDDDGSEKETPPPPAEPQQERVEADEDAGPPAYAVTV